MKFKCSCCNQTVDEISSFSWDQHIEVEQNGHPLALEQVNGITKERLGEIYACIVHKNCLDFSN